MLETRGLPPEVVAAAAAEAFAQTDEAAAALAAGRRWVGGRRGLAAKDPETARRRLAGYLSRRGYGGEAIARALRALLSGRRTGDPDAD